jgi:hypothetical protein
MHRISPRRGRRVRRSCQLGEPEMTEMATLDGFSWDKVLAETCAEHSQR